jgi:hypothetical protein
MKRINVDRLLEAARVTATQSETAAAMPSHLRTRILAHWRAGETEEDWFLPVALRRGLLCAGLIMMICVAWSSTDLLDNDDNELAVAGLADVEEFNP